MALNPWYVWCVIILFGLSSTISFPCWRRAASNHFWGASVWMVVSVFGRRFSAHPWMIFFFRLLGMYSHVLCLTQMLFLSLSAYEGVQWLLPTGSSTSLGYSQSRGSSVDLWRCLRVSWQVWLTLSGSLAWHLHVSRAAEETRFITF